MPHDESLTALWPPCCRRTCGGHGYSKLSGLPTLFQNYVQNVTWEGDNNVLCLQTARYLVKALAGAAAGQQVQGSAAYLNSLQQLLASRCGLGWQAYKRVLVVVGPPHPTPGCDVISALVLVLTLLARMCCCTGCHWLGSSTCWS